MTPRHFRRILGSVVAAAHVVTEIRAMLEPGRRAADLPLLERTLTDGYATVLTMEAERWRLERRMSEVAGTLDEGNVTDKTDELTELAKRLESSQAEIAALRRLLVSLRAHVDDVRTTA
jgi:ABC-type phosphate transport system auxiliary subunit